MKTLKLMKTAGNRFNKTARGKAEYIASNYLANMLTEEEYHLKQKISDLKSIRGKTNGPTFKMPKAQEWYKKSSELQRLNKMKQV